MQPNIVQHLLDINHLFYQNFAGPFARTRRRLQPGVRQVMQRLPLEANLVDLGCGNGELAVHLAERGQRGVYLGLDFSRGLLDEAENAFQASRRGALQAIFQEANLAEPEALPEKTRPAQPVTAVLAFAVLHHIPSQALRLRLLIQVRTLLEASPSPEPVFIHSVWQFLNSSKLAARCLPWERAGLTEEQVERGDHLLDWRHAGYGLRYAHHFSKDELQDLAQASGFRVIETFLSDGEGGKLGLYQTWELGTA
ncbi:MAG: class I SAM-dependent methyltransferase [Anaerolineaceae bacterium]|nr:class I SAM-dependent methyltransferase [Anaerolineaceae bacterium]